MHTRAQANVADTHPYTHVHLQKPTYAYTCTRIASTGPPKCIGFFSLDLVSAVQSVKDICGIGGLWVMKYVSGLANHSLVI